MLDECVRDVFVSVKGLVEGDSGIVVLGFVFVGECFDGIPENVCVFGVRPVS